MLLLRGVRASPLSVADSGRFSPRCERSPRSPRAPRSAPPRAPLYTAAERARRDSSPWTVVQGVLAPLQFVVMLASVALVLRFLATGEGLAWATASIVVKTALLVTIMVTGSIWEKQVFGRWLFAPAFFWEDVVSFGVIALHAAYVVALVSGTPGPRGQMVIALVAYAAYTINALQFLAKLRAARRDEAQRPKEAR